MPKIATLSALAGLALALAPGCQVLFGDYKVDTKGLEAQVCRVDEYRCTGALLEVCAANRSHWETFAMCDTADQCNLNADSCRPCQAGVERQCAGATLFTCNASGQWEKLKDCASAALCSAAIGDCIAPGCTTPGKHRCSPEGVLERCSADQARWERVAACASPADCNADQADAQVAVGSPASCVITCARGSGACESPTCDTPGSFRCLRDLSLERCSESFRWGLITVCPNFGLCDDVEGRCNPAACDSNERRCTRNTVEKCKADLTGWAVVSTCAAGQLCDPAAAPGAECVAGPCTAGETRCNSVFVEQCSAAGTWERSKRCAGRCDPATKSCSAAP